MLLEEIALLIQDQIDSLSRRVATLESDASKNVNWKELIGLMEKRLKKLETEIDYIKKT